MEVVVTDVVRDEGSVVLMQGLTTDGSDRVITFACDHRPAHDILDALANGDETFVLIEDWQVLGNVAMPRLEDTV